MPATCFHTQPVPQASGSGVTLVVVAVVPVVPVVVLPGVVDGQLTIGIVWSSPLVQKVSVLPQSPGLGGQKSGCGQSQDSAGQQLDSDKTHLPDGMSSAQSQTPLHGAGVTVVSAPVQGTESPVPWTLMTASPMYSPPSCPG